MARALLALPALLLVAFAGCASDEEAPPETSPAAVDGRGDAVVVAVIDTGFDPYHWDFLAAKMPQAQNADPSDDLPLWEDPAGWLPGHPGAGAFASYTRMDLTLDAETASASPQSLHDGDREAWEAVEPSEPGGDVHMGWIPGTKVIGFVDFAGDGGFATASHGVGTSSVSVGNLHGTCPECLFVFVNGFSDEAVAWVAQQDWIDVQTNSWGYSKVATDKIWTDCDLETERAGVERGQQIFFSGGNGMANAFDAPVLTLYSCQKGADWVVAVGANTPQGATYTGHGKPADIANVGSSYPSAGGASVNDDGSFGGTSNATPVTAGLFAQALHDLRQALAGPSRVQEGGAVARGPAGCGAANPACPLADGTLTVHELRQALYDAAPLLDNGFAAVDETATVPAPAPAESRYLSQGHGSLFGRIGDAAAEAATIAALADGSAAPAGPDPDEAAFQVAVSYCSQQVWGLWGHGAWNVTVPLPGPDPAWPLRTWFVEDCPAAMSAFVAAADAVEVPPLA